MRVLCDVCESSPADLLCCADEAPLCLACDLRVHAANKLAGKHQRLRFLQPSPSSSLPSCDICQEKTALIFCLEDRAVLCRDCDVSIHAAKTLAANHRRFLCSGVRVALNSDQGSAHDASQSSPDNTPQVVKQDVAVAVHQDNDSTVSSVALSSSSSASQQKVLSAKKSEDKLANLAAPGDNHQQQRGKASGEEEWQADDAFLGTEYALGGTMSSKADLTALDNEDWMKDFSLFDEHFIVEALLEVPEISPVTSISNNHHGRPNAVVKGKYKQDMGGLMQSEDISVVPDLGLFEEGHVPSVKRQRMYPGI